MKLKEQKRMGELEDKAKEIILKIGNTTRTYDVNNNIFKIVKMLLDCYELKKLK